MALPKSFLTRQPYLGGFVAYEFQRFLTAVTFGLPFVARAPATHPSKLLVVSIVPSHVNCTFVTLDRIALRLQ